MRPTHAASSSRGRRRGVFGVIKRELRRRSAIEPLIPAGRVATRRLREVLRLGFAGISKHEIARRIGLAASTVRETMARFKAAGLDWPLPDSVTDSELEAKLYKNAGTKQGHRRHAEPDWVCLHRELRRKHVTLSILRDEYIEQHPDGYRYSRFCELCRAWEGRLSVTMWQIHAGGDKQSWITPATPRRVIDRRTGGTAMRGCWSPTCRRSHSASLLSIHSWDSL